MNGCLMGHDREHWTQAVAERDIYERSLLADGPADEIEPHPTVVLVVEDEPLIRFATIDALAEAGYETMEASNADEALVLLGTRHVEAVVTDVNMPGSVDGLGLSDRVRSAWPRTRVIITSGLVRLANAQLDSGVSFIPKPYRHEDLVALLPPPVTASP